jgi:hypothetical protein
MARQATLLVADEIFYNLSGKAILQGIYHADIAIPSEQSVAPQLLFFFIAEADMSDPFQSFSVEVTFPGSDPVRQSVALFPPALLAAQNVGRNRLFYKHPLLVPTPTLRPGRIEAKVIHEKGEIIVGAPWIIFNPAVAKSVKAN